MWQIYLQTIAFSLDSIIKLLRFSVVVYLCCCPCITLKFILLAIIKTWKQTLPKLCLCTYRVNIHHYDKWRKVPVEGWKYPEILLAASALLREIYGVKLLPCSQHLTLATFHEFTRASHFFRHNVSLWYFDFDNCWVSPRR